MGRLQYRKIRPSGGPTGNVAEYVETVYGTSAAAHNKGRVTQVVTKNSQGVEQDGKLAFEYDALGRATKQTRTIDGVNYVVEKNFDTAGYLRGMKYPDNDILGQFGGSGSALVYDGAGRLSTIPGILSSVTYNALGAPLVQTNANGTTTTKTYDPNRFWLTDIDTTAPSLVLQNLHYTPNAAGMVTAVDSDISNEDWTYSYDEMNRLISSTNGAAGNDQTWTYDSLGRFTSNSRVGTTFTYPGAGVGVVRPHAPTSISGGPLGSLSFSYDGNGNLTSGNGRTYTWNENNQITQVIANSATTNFVYGPDGDRIKKTSGATVAKYPFGDDYEIDASGTVTKYFNAGFGPIAKKVGTTLYWLHTDRLGSINASTDASGAQVLRRSHRAYGGLLAQTGTAAVSEYPTVGNPGTSKQVTVNRTGRYVRIQLPGTNYLHMAEVEVWSSGVNVALLKAATQSSTWAPGVGVAGVAVDGSPGPGITHTLLNLEPWWEVDLGAEYLISSVTVWNRTDCCQDRLSDFSVFVSNTPFTSTSMAITRLSSSESLGYIGQRTDSETGLTYLHARYYDSSLGVFLSPDPIGADRNTYRYSFGDSVNFSDPSGLTAKDAGEDPVATCDKLFPGNKNAAAQCADALAIAIASNNASESIEVNGNAPRDDIHSRAATSLIQRAVEAAREAAKALGRRDACASSSTREAAAAATTTATLAATKYRPNPNLDLHTHIRNLARGAIITGAVGQLVGEAAGRLPRGSAGRVLAYAVATGLNAASTAEYTGLTLAAVAVTTGTSPAVSPAPGIAATSLAFSLAADSAKETGESAAKTIDALTEAAASCDVPDGGTQ